MWIWILTHWGRVTHICVNKLTIIGWDNGLFPGRWPFGTNFIEFLIAIHTFSFQKMCLKMSSGKWRPFCLVFLGWWAVVVPPLYTFIKTLRPRYYGHHFADDTFKCIFLNENISIPIKISLKFVPKCSINNIPALPEIMAWRRPGDKPLSEPMMVSSVTHICVIRPQGVKPRLKLGQGQVFTSHSFMWAKNLIHARPNLLRGAFTVSKNGRHFTDDVFKCILLNKNYCILIKISLKFVP